MTRPADTQPGAGIDLTTPYRPVGIFYAESDRYEILLRDCATFVSPVPDSDVYVLKDMETKEIVGMGVSFARSTLADAIPSAPDDCSICNGSGYDERGRKTLHKQRCPNGCEVLLACFDCRLPYGDPAFADFVVPDDVWRQLSPSEDEGGILCATCMIRRAETLGITSDGQFTSGPFADHGWRKPVAALGDDLVEVVAQAIYEGDRTDDEPTLKPWPAFIVYDPPCADLYRRQARIVLAVIRDKIAALEREECAMVAEGPLYKERYRGTEHGNWSIDGSSPYGKGRLDAAKRIRQRGAK